MSPIQLMLLLSIVSMLFYNGLLVDLRDIGKQVDRARVRMIVGLAVVNYLMVPVATCAVVVLLRGRAEINATFLILSALPCAPMVPTLVRFFNESEGWAMLVFFLFSVLSLAMLPLMLWALRLPIVGADVLPPWAEIGKSIGKYLLLVYAPIFIGVAMRTFARGFVLAYKELVGKISSSYSLFALTLFTYHEHERILSLSANEYAIFFVIEAICIVFALILGKKYGGPPATRVLVTALRNFAMALAFAGVVLPHTSVAMYMIVFSITPAALAVLALLGIKAVGRLVQGYRAAESSSVKHGLQDTSDGE